MADVSAQPSSHGSQIPATVADITRPPLASVEPKDHVASVRAAAALARSAL